jgi:hypothetical protein
MHESNHEPLPPPDHHDDDRHALEQQMSALATREAHLRLWMKQERQIARWTGAGLIGFALYLWLFDTVLWAFSPALMVKLLPLVVAAGGAYLIWNVQDDLRLRKHILRMRADELRRVSGALIPAAGALTIFTLTLGNPAQVFVAAMLVIVGVLNLWRAAKVQGL